MRMKVINNKNNFFLVIGLFLAVSFFHFAFFSSSIHDARVVYSVSSTFLDTTVKWEVNYYKTPDYKATVLSYGTTAYKDVVDTSYKNIELVVKTDNKKVVNEVAMMYLKEQLSKDISPVLIETKIVKSSKPINKSIGLFIVLLTLSAFVRYIITRKK